MAKTKTDVRYVLSELDDKTATLGAIAVALKSLNKQLDAVVLDVADIKRALERAERGR